MAAGRLIAPGTGLPRLVGGRCTGTPVHRTGDETRSGGKDSRPDAAAYAPPVQIG